MMDWKRLWPWSTPRFKETITVEETPNPPSRGDEIAQLEQRNKRAIDWLNAEVFQFTAGKHKDHGQPSSSHD